jgi:hypothetical protein
MQHAHADLAAQLAAALTDLSRARAALYRAEQDVAHWQALYQGALEGKVFYEAAYRDTFKEAYP